MNRITYIQPTTPELKFGADLKEVFPPWYLHPALKNLLYLAQTNFRDRYSNRFQIEAMLSSNDNKEDGPMKECLKIKEIMEKGKNILDVTLSPGVPVWVFRHFLGLLPTTLFPVYHEGDTWAILAYHYFNKYIYSVRKKTSDDTLTDMISMELTKLPSRNLTLLFELFELIRFLSAKNGYGVKLDSHSVTLLVRFFTPCLFIRPFRPGILTKSDKPYVCLIIYIVTFWPEIRQKIYEEILTKNSTSNIFYYLTRCYGDTYADSNIYLKDFGTQTEKESDNAKDEDSPKLSLIELTKPIDIQDLVHSTPVDNENNLTIYEKIQPENIDAFYESIKKKNINFMYPAYTQTDSYLDDNAKLKSIQKTPKKVRFAKTKNHKINIGEPKIRIGKSRRYNVEITITIPRREKSQFAWKKKLKKRQKKTKKQKALPKEPKAKSTDCVSILRKPSENFKANSSKSEISVKEKSSCTTPSSSQEESTDASCKFRKFTKLDWTCPNSSQSDLFESFSNFLTDDQVSNNDSISGLTQNNLCKNIYVNTFSDNFKKIKRKYKNWRTHKRCFFKSKTFSSIDLHSNIKYEKITKSTTF